VRPRWREWKARNRPVLHNAPRDPTSDSVRASTKAGRPPVDFGGPALEPQCREPDGRLSWPWPWAAPRPAR